MNGEITNEEILENEVKERLLGYGVGEVVDSDTSEETDDIEDYESDFERELEQKHAEMMPQILHPQPAASVILNAAPTPMTMQNGKIQGNMV